MEELTGKIIRVRTYKSLEGEFSHGYEVPEWCIPEKKKGEKTVEIIERDLDYLNHISTLMAKVSKYHLEIGKNIAKDHNIETIIQI